MPQPERKRVLVTRFTTASFHLGYFFFAVLCLSSSSLIRLVRWRLIVESKCRYVTAALAVSSSLPSWFFSSPCPLAGFLISNNHILTRESFSLSFLRSRHSRIPSPSPSHPHPQSNSPPVPTIAMITNIFTLSAAGSLINSQTMND